MEPLQGTFDLGLSGLIEDSNRKTMPDFLSRLAESEIDYEPPTIEVPNIPYDKDSNLLRANELTSDGSRDTNKESKYNIERKLIVASDTELLFAEQAVHNLQANDVTFERIHANLLERFPKEVVNKYFESAIKLILNKYSYLGFENLRDRKANIIAQSKIDFRVRRSTTNEILEKFSKLDYITPEVVRQFKTLLSYKRPLFVASKFLFSLNELKKAHDIFKTDKSSFSRDADEKTSSIRDIDNNTKKNSTIDRQNKFASMLNMFKSSLYAGMTKNKINEKLARAFGLASLETFNSTYSQDMKKIEGFYKRQSFDTDFASSMLQGAEVNLNAKPISIDTKEMMNYAFNLMSNGKKMSSIKDSLNQQFGLEASNQYWEANESKLQKHYGQLGYVFIDSNIYKTCNEMKESFEKLKHPGSKLIFSVKANSKCTGCTCHKDGKCDKIDLLVSNNPLVRSPRAARRVFEKGASFLPKTYLDEFSSQISYDGNSDLVSKFSLGIEDALNVENVSKTASDSTSMYESFITPNSYNTDIFKEQSESRIIDDVLKQSTINKEAFKKKIKGWDVEVDEHVSKGADPTNIMTVKLKKDKDKIELQEFQGIVKIDWEAQKTKDQEIPVSIPISNFAGVDKTKDLDKLLSTIDAPTWTEITKAYYKFEESLGEAPASYDYR